MTRWTVFIACLLAGVSMVTPTACSQPATDRPQNPSRPITTFPHIVIHRSEGFVDLDATVIMRQRGWLELLACTPETRTHESILAVPARPSHVHLALGLLGLEPGAPMRWRQEDGQTVAHAAHGPPVAVTVITSRNSLPVEAPANRWVINQKTGQPLPDNVWLFVGSSIDDTKDPPLYLADTEGSVLSLVQFGHEVLARATTVTNQNDEGMIAPNTDEIPEVGTPVTIRLRPIVAPPTTQPD